MLVALDDEVEELAVEEASSCIFYISSLSLARIFTRTFKLYTIKSIGLFFFTVEHALLRKWEIWNFATVNGMNTLDFFVLAIRVRETLLLARFHQVALD